MVQDAIIVGSLVLMVVILASILGAIERRERLGFVGGIALFIIAHVFITDPATIGMAIAVIGVLIAAGSTIPMLRQSV